MKTEEPEFTNPHKLRIQAEKLLKKKKAKALINDEKEADAKKLLHELQVHQIELEMHNEELRKAYETAEAALKKFTLVFDQTPMGFIMIENDGTIVELNFSAAEIMNDRRINMLGSNFKLYIAQESRIAFSDFINKTYDSHQKESCRVFLDNSPSSQVYIEGIVVENDNKCMLSIVDINRFAK